MASRELLEAVGKYIEKNYCPKQRHAGKDRRKKPVFGRFFLSGEERITKDNACESVQALPIDEVKEESFEECHDDSALMTEPEMYGRSSTVSASRNMPMAASSKRKLEDLMSQLEETFSQRLLRMIDERGMTDSQVYTKAYVDRRHFSKIRNDIHYSPSKKVVLAFSIALELSVDEAKDLLGSAGFALSRSSKTDVIVTYFLENRIYDMFEINEVLDAYGQPVF